MFGKKFDDQVVVVTGASSGIGRIACQQLLDGGAKVVAVARRDQALEDLAREAEFAGGQLLPVTGDVAEPGTARRVIEEAIEAFGHVDAWVNNAAVNAYGPVEAAPHEDVERLIAINLTGYLFGVQAAVTHFREQGRGTLVNVSSVLGFVPSPFQASYVATKHGIHGLTGAVRQEVARDGISVAEVAVGPVDTPLFEQAANRMGREVTPPDPIVSPERVARAIVASIRRPRRLRVVGVANRATVAAGRRFPTLTEVSADRIMRRKHFGASPVPADPGNLHEPADSADARATGGWTSDSRGRPALIGATLVAGAGLAALVVAGVRSRGLPPGDGE